MILVLLAPFQSADHFAIPTGGLRCATTTGYFRAAFQAARARFVSGKCGVLAVSLYYREIAAASV
jgi:hypothetical protein